MEDIDRDIWAVIHRYNRLANAGKARVLTCPDCEGEFVFMLGPNDDPVAWCPHEDRTFYPGIDFWDRIKSVVSEHYLEQ